MQFVHAALTVLRRRLEYGRHDASDRPRFPRSQQEQRQGHGRRMRRYTWTWLQLRGSHLSPLALDPKRSHGCASLVFENGRQIDNRASRIASIFPTPPRALLIRSKEAEIHMLELLGSHALDEADLVAHGFQLSQRFIVVQQTDIGGGKISLVEHL